MTEVMAEMFRFFGMPVEGGRNENNAVLRLVTRQLESTIEKFFCVPGHSRHLRLPYGHTMPLVKFCNLWHPLLGLTEQCIAGSAAPDATLVALGLILSGRRDETPGEIEFKLNRKARLIFSRFSLPISSSGCFNVSPDGVFSISSGPMRLERRFNSSGDPHEVADWIMPQITNEEPRLYLYHHLLHDDYTSAYPTEKRTSPCNHIAKLRESIDLIEKFSPAYSLWIRRSTRLIVPLISPSGEMISGSNSCRPGEVQISTNVSTIQIAEMLVHEASHQHLYMASRLAPLLDGSTDGEYYSPVLRRWRPAAKILLAFHAFANVERFLRTCVASGYDDHGVTEAHLRQIQQETTELGHPFRKGSGLTVQGARLLDPLW
jgi:hypothetical protein